MSTQLKTIEPGFLLDYVSGEPVKETKKELVRQRIARALIHEYGISPDDMAVNFKVANRKKVDIAIFHSGKDHEVEHMSRAVLCRPEPQVAGSTVRIRDYEQAEADLRGLEAIMMEIESCKYGLWSNGLEFFFLEKEKKRSETICNPIGDWPMAEESGLPKDGLSGARTLMVQDDMLKVTFRRCHNFIHGNEGMPKDAAFWQFMYVIFCKIHDETYRRGERRFWAGPRDQFKEEGQKKIRDRIESLFHEVKQKFSNIFRGNEEITLSDRALAFMVSELAKYEFNHIDMDVKGMAYQEIAGADLRGGPGQFITPRGVVKLVVEMLDPKENERVLDPACGNGGFLMACLGYILKKFREEDSTSPRKNSGEFSHVHEGLKEYSGKMIFGADLDSFLISAAQMSMVMAGDGRGHLYHINSLEFPEGPLPQIREAKKDIPFGSIDVLMTNPPFGSDIPITGKNIFETYELACYWEPDGEGGFRNTGTRKERVDAEVLFIERCLKWLKPGTGRMCIVLPDGILGKPDFEYVRWWLMREAQVLASVSLPAEAFIPQTNILTSLLFLRRKSADEIKAEALKGKKQYPVFMAVAEKVGFDHRGNKLYKRTPEGEEIVVQREYLERVHIKGRWRKRLLKRDEKIEDNDLPVIAEKYREFVQKYDTQGDGYAE